MSNFYPFEVVDRASETQHQVVENVNKLLSRIGVNIGCHHMGQVCQYELLGEGGHFHSCQAVSLPGMTGPPNSFTARGPVTLTSILSPQPAV